MTVPLSPGSSRGIAAARFGAELAKAMHARKVGQIRLAEAVGCAKSAIPNWKAGVNLPRVETAAKLAEVLERKARVKGGIPKAPLVAALEHYAARESRRVQRTDKLAGQVAGLRSVIDEMCSTCEPEGLCRTASCPLRPVSPLGLQQGADVREVRAVEGPWGPSNREAQLTAIRASNAERWSRPGEREAQSARSSARFAAMTDGERAEHGASISAGRRRSS